MGVQGWELAWVEIVAVELMDFVEEVRTKGGGLDAENEEEGVIDGPDLLEGS